MLLQAGQDAAEVIALPELQVEAEESMHEDDALHQPHDEPDIGLFAVAHVVQD